MTPTRSDQEYTHDTLRALIAEARERVAIYAFDIGGSTQLDEREAVILNDVVAWYDAHVVPFAYAWEKQLEAAKAREEALGVDARRYRVIRDGRDGDIMKQPAYRPEECGIWGGEELDEWCDRMMTEWAASEPPGTAEGKEDR